MNIWRFRMHQNQQVILSLLFYRASHEGRIYSLPKLQISRRVTVSRPVCLGLKDSYCLIMKSVINILSTKKNQCNNKDLLTECEVCTRKYFPLVFVQTKRRRSEVYMGKYLPLVFVQTKRRRSEVCAKKPQANTFPYRPSKRG